MSRLIPILALLLTSSAAVAVITLKKYKDDTLRAYQNLSSGTKSCPTDYGMVTYIEGGSGYPVLLLHGAGGGFDQARLMAETMAGPNARWIAPSRFGYPGTDIPDNATLGQQAHCLVQLMDTLHIDRFAVIALSAGGGSAVQLALDYPERCSSLILVSSRVKTIPEADGSEKFFISLFRKDVRFWLVSRVFTRRFLIQCGMSGDIIAREESVMRKQSRLMIETMYPARPRLPGILFDVSTGVSPRQPQLDKIDVPTLVIHARDDRLITYDHALFSSKMIPDAELLSFEDGGHGTFIIHGNEISSRITDFTASRIGETAGESTGLHNR